MNHPKTNAARLAADPSDTDVEQLLAACGLKVPPQCGTVAAYMRHLSISETPCQPCHSTFHAARTGWASKPRRKRPIKHGTPAGARAHQYRKEPACGKCARAYRAYQNGQRAARKARAA